jgi:hypothetical protein
MATKEIWGPATWYLFHTLTYHFKEEYATQEKVKELFELFEQICLNVPCPYCVDHARKTLSQVNRGNIRTKQDLITLFFEFHNRVNERIHTPKMTIDEFNEKYSKALTANVVRYFGQVFSQSVRQEKAMTDNWNRRRILSIFFEYIQKNYNLFNSGGITLVEPTQPAIEPQPEPHPEPQPEPQPESIISTHTSIPINNVEVEPEHSISFDITDI